MSRRVHPLASCVLAGLAFGFLTSAINAASSPYTAVGSRLDGTVLASPLRVVSVLVDAGWAWAALALAAGCWMRRVRPALVGGAASLIAATLAYFAADALLLGLALTDSAGELAIWTAASVVFGPPLAMAGVLARRADAVGLAARLLIPAGALAQMAWLGQLSSGALGVRPEEVFADRLLVAAATVAVAALVAQHARRGGRDRMRSAA